MELKDLFKKPGDKFVNDYQKFIDDYQNFKEQMQQVKVYSGQNIAEVLQNNPHSWILESCDLEVPGYDLGGQQTANVKIRFFDPQVAALFMSACHNGIYNYTSPSISYTSPLVMEDKELDLGQHYVKDFGDD